MVSGMISQAFPAVRKVKAMALACTDAEAGEEVRAHRWFRWRVAIRKSAEAQPASNQWRRYEQVIDAHADVFVKIAGAVVPPRVPPGFRVMQSGTHRH